MNPLAHLRIRTRLLIATLGVIVVGFLALTLVAGRQIAAAARADYEDRVANTMRLVAQGASAAVRDGGSLDAILATYAEQVGGTLVLIPRGPGEGRMPPAEPDGDRDDTPGSSYGSEIEAAMRGGLVVVQRRDAAGQDALFTAATIGDGRRGGSIAQLSVPLAGLNRIIAERWGVLLLIFGLVTGAAVVLALLVARSILQPLYALRDSALRLSRGDLAHRVANVGRDEIGDVARAFNEMASQVGAMLEEQRAFASNTSHELRTPLTTIRLRSEALRYDDTLDPALRMQYVTEIDDEVIRLTGLIEDLTLLARFDAGRAELGATELDLGRFAHSIVGQMADSADARGVTLSVVAPDAPLIVSAGLNHLTVAVRNVLDNALKYTPRGGRVTLSVVGEGDSAILRVTDNGQGIGAEHLTHLFERFYRADRAHSRAIPGTGLGLSLVKSIVEAYGGSVRVESAGVGQGTTVTLRWPQAPAAS